MSLSVPRIALKSARVTFNSVRNFGKPPDIKRLNGFRERLVTGYEEPKHMVRQSKRIVLFALIPLAISLYLSYLYEQEYHHSIPEYHKNHKAYPYLSIRKREFPFGDGNRTLFHNPHMYVPGEGFDEDLSEQAGHHH